MAIYPEILAGYEAAATILANAGVSLTAIGALSAPIPTDLMGMMAAQPAAYSVEAIALREGINLCWNGKFGFDKGWQLVKYPVPHTDPVFAERLVEVLLPVVEEFKAKAQEEKLKDYAQDKPEDVYEAVDAITEVK
jgi:hypothetical protein